VEQLVALRAIPGLITLRPADANEVVEAWRLIVRFRHEPAALILTRLAVPILDRKKYASAEGAQRGAYIPAGAGGGKPDVQLSIGSEVAHCIEAYERLKNEGIQARLISMPSWEVFEYYGRQRLPRGGSARGGHRSCIGRTGVDVGWAQYVGPTGHTIGMKTFGASAPLKELQRKFGSTTEGIIAAAKDQVARFNCSGPSCQ
jgi:transketolase